MIRNSLQINNCEGSNVLILAPHEDDEINIAVNFILTVVSQGRNVYVAYTTNGDYKTSAGVRIREAVNCLKKLGVAENNIFFFGYGDNQYLDTCVFSSRKGNVRSVSGHYETYAPDGYTDYSFKIRGKHSEYNYTAFKNDLYDCIDNIRPDVIFCVDFDNHIDHRMLSLAFDEVMGKILALKDNLYHPVICKTFAYSISYFADEDYLALDLRETLFPSEKNYKKHENPLIGKSIYDWDNRVRFPLFVGKTYPLFLVKQPIYRALRQYVSQYALFRIKRIINSDQIFWIRRTDSITYKALVTSTSGDISRINDFMLYNAEDIDRMDVSFENYLWRPAHDDDKKVVSFIWDTAETICYFRIYGNIDGGSLIKKIRITLDNGYCTEAGPLSGDGRPLELLIPAQENICKCDIQILEYTGQNYGISEIEIFRPADGSVELTPYIKIMVENNFIYDYYTENQCLDLDVYKWNTEGDVKFEIISGEASLSEQRLTLKKRNRPVTVKACMADNAEIFDLVKIYWIKNKKARQCMIKGFDNICLAAERIRCYVINYFHLAFERGVRETVTILIAKAIGKWREKGRNQE